MHTAVQLSDDSPFRVSPVDVSTVQERVYESFKLALLQGRFLPGEIISLRRLAKEFGTSPMPVREAVHKLMAAKILVQSPGRLIRVAPFTRQNYEEHIRIRARIEGYAAERACAANSPDLIGRLISLNQSMLDAAEAYKVDAAIAANQSFHFAVYDAARSPQLLDVISTLWLRTGPFVATARHKPQQSKAMFQNGFRAHGRLINAIATQERKSARQALGLDIRTATVWLRKNYEFGEDN